MFQADDRSLIVLVDWVGFEVDERTWEPFKEIFLGRRGISRKGVAEVACDSCYCCSHQDRIWYSIVIFSTSWRFLCIEHVARINLSNALWGCYDEIRLSVEFVTVGFLGICRHSCCDSFPVSWRADEATPGRGTPIIEC